VREHVVVEPEALVGEGFEDQVRDGREIVRLRAEMARVSVLALDWLEPWLALEGFRLFFSQLG